MKLLLVSHPPLTAESGAAQITLGLAEALRARGHEALAWSPEPLPPGIRWWDLWRARRRALERHVREAGPFDVIDAPALSLSPRLARAALLVARSFQPELLYLGNELRSQLRRPTWRTPFHAAHGAIVSAGIVGGWGRAAVLLCLGTVERDWMRRRLPRRTSRLRVYVVAPPPAEREIFATVRRDRPSQTTAPGTCFLWIGRWTSHKGTARLVRFLRRRAATHPDDSFTIAGCGSAAERDVPASLLRLGRVKLVPAFSRADLPALLAAHDAGLFTSSVEGWGLCLNEMLESGLTVYATRAGGVADLTPYWPGRLLPFPPPDLPAPPSPEPDLAPYFERFSWADIARRYEEDVLCG